MPLPTDAKQLVVPLDWKGIYDLFTCHDAWYSGDIQKLHSYYAGKKNFHWSRNPFEDRRSSLHVPIAGDLATTSADLLFSEGIEAVIKEAQDGKDSTAVATQDRLTEIIEATGVYNKLLEGGEMCAGMGGVYLKVNWDSSLSPYPILSIAQADTALPEFKHGILQAVNFWKVIAKEGDSELEFKEDTRKNPTGSKGAVYRLVERHEKVLIGGKYIGFILNGLYKGTTTELGVRIPLNTFPETADIPEEINTRIEGLLVRYIPNRLPNRLFRGSSMGQSDFSGVEGLMDALDEVYSSWMRDIRLGQGRILVPEAYLEPKSDGTLMFDIDQEAYTKYAGNPTSEDNGITLNQFDIRTTEHRETAIGLLERIVSHAGYSVQTFGLQLNVAESGKALRVKEKKTYTTTVKKKRYWEPALSDILYIMLQVDAIHLGSRITPYKPDVIIPDTEAEDFGVFSQSLQFLDAASALSIETKVRMVNKDWNEEQIQAEVERIKAERGIILGGGSNTKE